MVNVLDKICYRYTILRMVDVFLVVFDDGTKCRPFDHLHP